jgi:hypothetical protein
MYTSALMVQCNILWCPLESSVVDLPRREPNKSEWYGNTVHTCYIMLLYPALHAEFVDLFMIHLRTKHHMTKCFINC